MSEQPAVALVELTKLKQNADAAERSRLAWQVVLGAEGSEEFPILLDFAQENGLIAGLTGADRTEIRSWINPIDESEMVPIPPGPFLAGKDRRSAACAAFSLARYPVTNAQFKQFLDETDYGPDDGAAPGGDSFLAHWRAGRIPRGQDRHPVVWVSFVDAVHYCRWAQVTLPTEWSWEKAARGPDGRDLPWGNAKTAGRQEKFSLYQKLTNLGSKAACAVGQFPRTRTPFGCEDMIGNVSEWCQPTPLAPSGPGQALSADTGFFPPAGKVCVGLDPNRGAGRRTTEGTTAVLAAGFAEGAPDGGFAIVRGSCYRRIELRRIFAWHRHCLALTRRNAWVGFRPALLLPIRPA